MSGWIKLEKDRRDDPRVIRMARELRNAAALHERFTSNAHVTLVLGCLDVLWCYADTHIRDDDTLDLGIDEIDELVGLVGFCNLMPSDWLEIIDAKSVKLPDFHRHNGTESKRRALSQKRTERHRNATPLQPTEVVSRTSVTSALPDLDQTKTRPIKKKKASQFEIPSGLHEPSWNRWLEYRKDVGKPVKPASMQAAASDLAKYGTQQPEVVQQSIAAGWQGLFPLKPNGAHGNGSHQQVPARKLSAVERVYAATAHLCGDDGSVPGTRPSGVGVEIDGGAVRPVVPGSIRR